MDLNLEMIAGDLRWIHQWMARSGGRAENTTQRIIGAEFRTTTTARSVRFPCVFLNSRDERISHFMKSLEYARDHECGAGVMILTLSDGFERSISESSVSYCLVHLTPCKLICMVN